MTKFQNPQSLSTHLLRPRLYELLEEQTRSKLTLLLAPAGFGKTTLIGGWVKQRSESAGWISLDKSDNDPVRFWGCIGKVLEELSADLGKRVQSSLHAAALPSAEVLPAKLINELSRISREFVLVLDDYHLITNEQIHQNMLYFIENMPETMHVIISTRVVPRFPLHRLRARELVREIGVSELHFNLDETFSFFNQLKKFDISREDLDILQYRTEGWIAGMQLVALSMQGRDNLPRFVREFTGNHRYIWDYVVEEVFMALSGEMQDFLLRTSILERMTPSLCDSVTRRQQSEEILAYLEATNSFIVALDQERRWYRYHHLFSDMLQTQLRRKYADQIDQLHLAASHWYERNLFWEEAVEHALSGGHFDQAAALIDKLSVTLLKQGKLATLKRWLHSFPERWLQYHLKMAVIYLWTLVLSGELEQTFEQLSREEQYLTTADLPAEEANEAIAELFVIRGYLAMQERDVDRALACFRESTKRQPNKVGRFFQSGIELNAGEALVLRSPMCMGGELGKVEEVFTKLRVLWKNSGLSILGYGSAVLGELYYEKNVDHEVEYFVHRGIELGQKAEHIGILVPIYLTYARWKRAHRDRVQMWAVMEELEEQIQLLDASDYWLEAVEAFKVRLWIEENRLERVDDWIKRSSLNAIRPFAILQEFEYITLARAWIALDQTDQALALLTRLLLQAERAERLASMIELNLLISLLHQKQGDERKAVTALNRALCLGEPHGYLRTFLDEGDWLARLLQTLNKDKYRLLADQKALHYAERLLSYFPAEHAADIAQSPTVGQARQLTRRELEVLAYMKQGYTNQRIAREMCITVDTVKTHTKNIYEKLGVNNRTQAISLVIERGIL
ncbi:LuxR C-terminal-related transcriptional regulator [Brevibacillus sp. B_LB10_24]